ncbi:MAG: polysaccharide deacetylase family protein [Solirubrobacterales bacterium]|nr:polysaccharide deacetylase family protein [Solirubrobacterales bacterium]
MSGALILTYHAVEDGPAPLCIPPALFAEHLDVLAEAGATILTMAELAAALAGGTVPPRAVAITFDDGLASVSRQAAPLLRERGMRATVFCVTGHIGGRSDWPTQPPGVEPRPLAGEGELRELAGLGWELGSHGMAHAPLSVIEPAALEEELVRSRALLEPLAGGPVVSYAFPYGARPTGPAHEVVRATYTSACATRLGLARPGGDLHDLPRVDAHYVRAPRLLRRVITGGGAGYLALRRAGARARRLVVQDHAPAAADS